MVKPKRRVISEIGTEPKKGEGYLSMPHADPQQQDRQALLHGRTILTKCVWLKTKAKIAYLDLQPFSFWVGYV
jgi:hypothetical protein